MFVVVFCFCFHFWAVWCHVHFSYIWRLRSWPSEYCQNFIFWNIFEKLWKPSWYSLCWVWVSHLQSGNLCHSGKICWIDLKNIFHLIFSIWFFWKFFYLDFDLMGTSFECCLFSTVFLCVYGGVVIISVFLSSWRVL